MTMTLNKKNGTTMQYAILCRTDKGEALNSIDRFFLITKAQEILEYKPTHNLQNGLKQAVDWLVSLPNHGF